jgi:hypothetical protein
MAATTATVLSQTQLGLMYHAPPAAALIASAAMFIGERWL